MAGKTPNGKGGWLGGSAVPSWDPGTLTYHMQEQTQQRVDYSYDNNPLNGSYSQNAWGRLTAVQFHDENTGGPFSYMYSYNQAGLGDGAPHGRRQRCAGVRRGVHVGRPRADDGD